MEKIISQACSFLSDCGFDWSICGGTAIDIFLCRQTRIHKDLDVAVFWEDRNTIIELMLGFGWRVFEACGGGVVLELSKKQDAPFEKRNCSLL
ncbi:nucleotidyltransferase domain-containing protein [Paenibacillus sp. Marseille-Q7038]